ncbi:Uncharacterised protein [uncultured Roseburia sp.]|uniref:Uncharacterized protein n=1 Tax=Brotonthovivens ammoniilytica TaxID=2981725 RepID=A0ABT2TKU7_9FIRM|nr:hypothetical protein [Brotonthovivens ammoniilytica]MCU6762301.1 hypothetical protein [Brotonthovivens ammoniilytica]SCI67186.1 Uncharacterised protein [uncultured Roseburia sp.]
MDDYVFVDVDPKFRQLLKSIFTDEFMKSFTNFENFEGFQYSSAVITNWNSERMVYSQLLMDNFVRESTRFSSWNEMVIAASDQRFGKAKVN